MNENFIEKRSIELPHGEILEVEMTKLFISKLVQHFELDSPNDLTNDHIRMFVWGSLNNAVEKAEKELESI